MNFLHFIVEKDFMNGSFLYFINRKKIFKRKYILWIPYVQELKHTIYKETLRELGLSSLRKRRLTAVYEHLLGGCAEDRSKLFSVQLLKGKWQKTCWNSILKRKVKHQKNPNKQQQTISFSLRVVKQWEHIVELLFLEIHKDELDPALYKPAQKLTSKGPDQLPWVCESTFFLALRTKLYVYLFWLFWPHLIAVQF